VAELRGRGVKGDLWRFLGRTRVARALGPAPGGNP